ncbi:MAG: dethiobiotin synthase [Candidatus Porifericomitaceae bacterium WSBS_2022_MAG_OTU9]
MTESKALLVTGTDTGIGKTRVAVSMLMSLGKMGLEVAGMKPVASGCRLEDGELKNEDALLLVEYSTVKLPYKLVNPFAYEPPIAPHIAAARSGQPIDFTVIETAFAAVSARAEFVVVEGVGGWRVPFAGSRGISFLAHSLRLPVLLVVGMKLGCINHALLTVEAIRKDNGSCAGWVANVVDPEYDTLNETVQTLSEALAMEPLAVVPHSATPEPLALSSPQEIFA